MYANKHQFKIYTSDLCPANRKNVSALKTKFLCVSVSVWGKKQRWMFLEVFTRRQVWQKHVVCRKKTIHQKRFPLKKYISFFHQICCGVKFYSRWKKMESIVSLTLVSPELHDRYVLQRHKSITRWQPWFLHTSSRIAIGGCGVGGPLSAHRSHDLQV